MENNWTIVKGSVNITHRAYIYYLQHIPCRYWIGSYSQEEKCSICSEVIPSNIRIQLKLLQFDKWGYL